MTRAIRLRLLLWLAAALAAWPSPPPHRRRRPDLVHGLRRPRREGGLRGPGRRLQAPHPQIQVTLIHVPGQGDYRKRLGIDFAAGTPADVVLLNYRRYAAFAARGVLEPLGPYLARSGVDRGAGLLPGGDGAVPLAGQAHVHPAEPLEPGRLLQQGPVRARRRARPTDDWTWDDFLARRPGADARHRRRRARRPVRPGHRGLDLPAGPLHLAERRRAGRRHRRRRPASRSTRRPRARPSSGSWTCRRKHHVVPDAVEEKAENSESRFLNGRLGMFLNSRRGVPTYRTITELRLGRGAAAAPPAARRHPARRRLLHAEGERRTRPPPGRSSSSPTRPRARGSSRPRGGPCRRSARVAESPAFLDPDGAAAATATSSSTRSRSSGPCR